MKQFFSGSLIVALISVLLSPIASYGATPPTAVQLEIVAPTTTRVGEAIDITVRAVDKDKKTATGYRGSVMFNTDSVGDIVPAIGKTIAFTADDNGEKKFSKGVVFKKSGKQKIYVTDASDDIIGEASITVDPAATTPIGTTDTITIVTPTTDSRITGDTLTVGGKARKNSKVSIILNAKEVTTALVDENGLFSYTITGLTQETNILSAKLIDSGTTPIVSPEIRFTRVANTATTYGVTISPATTVEASSPIIITVEATPGLASLALSLDGSMIATKETTPGKYMIETVAPLKAGTYPLALSQKDALGQAKTTDSSTSLTVTEKLAAPTTTPVAGFQNIKTKTIGSRIIFDFAINNPPTDLTGFQIAYGKNADSLSQEVNTLPLAKIASQTQSGWYTWYIDKIPADTYTFKIMGRTASWALISGLVSEPIVATIGRDSCSIGNIASLSVETDDRSSILSWESLSGATAYKIYRVSPAGDYTLFQTTTEPTYTIHLASGVVVYQDFVVKALCDTTTESAEYSKVTKVQTGPGMVAVVVVISALLGVILLRRRFI